MASARITARDLAQIAVFAALIAALTLPGAIPTGIPGVPITLQTLGVMLAGAILGARKGTIAVAVYVVLGLAGVPILSGGTGGIGVLFSRSGGFLLGFILAAFVIGLFTERLLPRYNLLPALGVTALGGILAIYAIGIPWMAAWYGLPTALLGSVAFLPGDVVKVLVTVIVAKAVHRAWPGVAPARSWRGRAEAPEPAAVDAA